MSTEIEKLLKSDEQIKNDILSDFGNAFLNELQRLADKHGKEEFMVLVQGNK